MGLWVVEDNRIQPVRPYINNYHKHKAAADLTLLPFLSIAIKLILSFLSLRKGIKWRFEVCAYLHRSQGVMLVRKIISLSPDRFIIKFSHSNYIVFYNLKI